MWKALIFGVLVLVTGHCHSAKLFSKAKLHPNCKQTHPAKNLNMEWALQLFVGKKFYMPMGAKTAYEDLTELLSGTKATKPTDIDKMCTEVRTQGFKSTVEGYEGRFLVVDCAVIKKGMQDCGANPRTEHPDRHKAVKSIQTLAWTDNESSIIIVRCTPSGDKNDWVLYSINSTVTEDLKKAVHDQVAKLGFPPSKYPMHHANYKACNLTRDDEE